MNIALLNLRITFQKNVIVSDKIGNRKNTWEDYFSCYATISGESGTETATAGQTIPTRTAAFTVRYCKDVAAVTTDDFRIVCGDELYNITNIDHMNHKRKALKFGVKKARR